MMFLILHSGRSYPILDLISGTTQHTSGTRDSATNRTYGQSTDERSMDCTKAFGFHTDGQREGSTGKWLNYQGFLLQNKINKNIL